MFTSGRLIGLLSLLIIIISTGCDERNRMAGSVPPPPPTDQAQPARTYDYSQKVLENNRHTGRKWTVAILRFGDTKEVEGVPFGKASSPSQSGSGEVNVNVKVGDDAAATPTDTPPEINKRARETLKHELVKSDAFTVVERERILEILREINFGKTKYINPDTAADEGSLLAVKYLVEGSIGLNEDMTLKNNLDKERTYKDGVEYQPGMFDNVFNPGKVNQEKMMIELRKMQEERSKNKVRQKYNISCYLSVYDVHTGAVVTTVMGLGTNGLEAINDAVEELIESLSSLDTDIHLAAVGQDKIYLDAGSNSGVKVGSRFQVLHQGQAIRDKDGQLIGYEEKEVGEIEVSEVRQLMSIARVANKTGEMSRGDLAKPAKH